MTRSIAASFRRTIGFVLFTALIFCAGCYGPPRPPPYADETYTVYLDGNPTNTYIRNTAKRTLLKSLPSMPVEETGFVAAPGTALILLYRRDRVSYSDAGFFLNGNRLGALSPKQKMVVAVPAGKARISATAVLPKAKFSQSQRDEHWIKVESWGFVSGGGQEFDAVAGELYAFEAKIIFGIDDFPAEFYGREPRSALRDSARFEKVQIHSTAQ